jgi:hypothetical protein
VNFCSFFLSSHGVSFHGLVLGSSNGLRMGGGKVQVQRLRRVRLWDGRRWGVEGWCGVRGYWVSVGVLRRRWGYLRCWLGSRRRCVCGLSRLTLNTAFGCEVVVVQVGVILFNPHSLSSGRFAEGSYLGGCLGLLSTCLPRKLVRHRIRTQGRPREAFRAIQETAFSSVQPGRGRTSIRRL